ncbi:hypothetical protein TNCV_2162201 [Trichonephila clavipes]|nr:hypothetical protein TNCV_2162201 [Trichonephila clavipes]
MRKWISNDTVLMAQWAAEGFDTHPMDASIRLGTNKTKVLGMAWQILDDCLTLDTKLQHGAAAYMKVRAQNGEGARKISSLQKRGWHPEASYFCLDLSSGALVAVRLSSRVQKSSTRKGVQSVPLDRLQNSPILD